MIDLYLRTASEADLVDALPWARGVDRDGEPIWLASGEGFALDIIGPVTATPGEYAFDGSEIVAPVVDDRFHANLCCTEEVAALVPRDVRIKKPGSPARVWA